MNDGTYRFKMMKGPASQDSVYYRAVFATENGAFNIYTLLRITVDSEFPFVRLEKAEENALTVVGDRGKEQWVKYIMPYIYKENDTFFFTVRNRRLVAKTEV